MAANPTIFVKASPIPEIFLGICIKFKHNVVVATGRSDCLSQMKNLGGLPKCFKVSLGAGARVKNRHNKYEQAVL